MQKLEFNNEENLYIYESSWIDNKPQLVWDVAKNDGLKFEDFLHWFKNYDLSEPMAIIHFTNFRY